MRAGSGQTAGDQERIMKIGTIGAGNIGGTLRGAWYHVSPPCRTICSPAPPTRSSSTPATTTLSNDTARIDAIEDGMSRAAGWSTRYRYQGVQQHLPGPLA